MDGWMDGWIDRQIDRQIDREIDRQINHRGHQLTNVGLAQLAPLMVRVILFA